MDKNTAQQLYEILQKTFQFHEFRPGQLEAITVLLDHKRLLCIQPTGYGKSLLYQLPSMLLDGVTLVISPLLALMRDQLGQLKTRFNISAASINSDQTDEENYFAKQAAITGRVRILFVSPEQLDSISRVEFLLKLPINLLVVDEAHCISTWGHDFRPGYRQITKLVHLLINKNPNIHLLGLTATANEKTEMDIKKQLTAGERSIAVHRENMNRPNIRLSVISLRGMASKLATLMEVLETQKGGGLIYCATRENTEIVAEYLCDQGVAAIAYHAGISANQKQRIQADFLQDKYPVIAATNALGMGIDKSNLRFILHFDFPGSITAYYQEVGRCGRDGLPAEGVLFYDPADSKVQQYFIDSSQPRERDFAHVLETMIATTISPNLSTLKRLTGLHPTRLVVIIAELVEQGFLKKISMHNIQVYQLTHRIGKPDLLRYSRQYQLRTAELNAMQHYSEQKKQCLMVILREALGDKIAQSCGQCSVCSEPLHQSIQNKDQIFTISSWLNRRTVPIVLSKKIKCTVPGIAVLDGKLRSSDFIHFMRERANSSILQHGLSNNLTQLIKDCLKDLAYHHKLGCIVPIPSRTWGARDALTLLLANYLKIPAIPDLLFWRETPAARQGELLNNDQRKQNIVKRMQALPHKKIPRGTILLFDDYTGSGVTLEEAARTLREDLNINNPIIPFTIAAIKWRLGKRGMI